MQISAPHNLRGDRFWGQHSRCRIKICGVKSLDAGYSAWELGADAIGLHAIGNQRSNFAQWASWLGALPTELSRFILVDLENAWAFLNAHDLGEFFDTIQLQGVVTPPDVATLARAAHAQQCRVVKSIGVADIGTEKAAQYALDIQEYVDAILLDQAFLGGRGVPQDWTSAATVRRGIQKPIILAGGLNEANVQEAMARVEPWGVDVETATECRLKDNSSEKGVSVKSLSKMGAFITVVASYNSFRQVKGFASLDVTVQGRLIALAKTTNASRYQGWESRDALCSRLETAVKDLTEAGLDCDAFLVAVSLSRFVSHSEVQDAWRNVGANLARWLEEMAFGQNAINWLQIENEDHIGRFFAANRFAGRNEPIVAPPIRNVEALWSTYKNVVLRREYADVQRLQYFSKRPVWLLLWDINASGQTVAKELSRIRSCMQLIPNNSGQERWLIVASAIFTEVARQKLLAEAERHSIRNVLVIGGIWLGLENTLQACPLITPSQLARIDSFSRAFYTTMTGEGSERAGLREIGPFGYRDSGLLLVTEDNCPNNAPPYFWLPRKRFTPPFPRTLSRSSGHVSHAPRDLDELTDVEMSRLNNAVTVALRKS